MTLTAISPRISSSSQVVIRLNCLPEIASTNLCVERVKNERRANQVSSQLVVRLAVHGWWSTPLTGMASRTFAPLMNTSHWCTLRPTFCWNEMFACCSRRVQYDEWARECDLDGARAPSAAQHFTEQADGVTAPCLLPAAAVTTVVFFMAIHFRQCVRPRSSWLRVVPTRCYSRDTGSV